MTDDWPTELIQQLIMEKVEKDAFDTVCPLTILTEIDNHL